VYKQCLSKKLIKNVVVKKCLELFLFWFGDIIVDTLVGTVYMATRCSASALPYSQGLFVRFVQTRDVSEMGVMEVEVIDTRLIEFDSVMCAQTSPITFTDSHRFQRNLLPDSRLGFAYPTLNKFSSYV